MRKWTGRELEWIADHGFRVSEDGRIIIPRNRWRTLSGTGKRLSDPTKKTLTIPSDHGLCLLTEGMHFEIIGR